MSTPQSPRCPISRLPHLQSVPRCWSLRQQQGHFRRRQRQELGQLHQEWCPWYLREQWWCKDSSSVGLPSRKFQPVGGVATRTRVGSPTLAVDVLNLKHPYDLESRYSTSYSDYKPCCIFKQREDVETAGGASLRCLKDHCEARIAELGQDSSSASCLHHHLPQRKLGKWRIAVDYPQVIFLLNISRNVSPGIVSLGSFCECGAMW